MSARQQESGSCLAECIANQLDRERLPFVASNQTGEYYSFNFPIGFGTPAQVWLEDGIGYHRIPGDYLPGARADAAVPQHSLALNGNAAGKTVPIQQPWKDGPGCSIVGVECGPRFKTPSNCCTAATRNPWMPP